MKIVMIIPFLVVSLYAESFDAFLAEAIQKSPYLKANQLNIDTAQQRASLTKRYKNPSLELETSNFAEDGLGNNIGYRVGVSQPLRLWGVAKTRDNLAVYQKETAGSFVKLGRANFVKRLSLLFVKYKKFQKEKELAKLELDISKKILNISKSRFDNGTIAKVKYMQAKVDAKRGENFLNEANIRSLESYYALMSFSGMDAEIALDSSYVFRLNKTDSLENSASLLLTQNRQKIAEAQAQLYANKIEWVTAFGEFEREPTQSITRVGVSIPLALFNRKTQEKEIAKIKAKASGFMLENQRNSIKLKLIKLTKSIQALHALEMSSKELLVSQNELLLMYEDGYKIANINLIELQLIKNQMIQTKAKLINIQSKKERNIIQHNFLTGTYNE